MKDPRDYKIDISSLQSGSPAEQTRQARPFLMVHFKCCGVYQRIYRNREGTRYEGFCPKCAKPVRFKVGDGGTDARAFSVE